MSLLREAGRVEKQLPQGPLFDHGTPCSGFDVFICKFIQSHPRKLSESSNRDFSVKFILAVKSWATLPESVKNKFEYKALLARNYGYNKSVNQRMLTIVKQLCRHFKARVEQSEANRKSEKKTALRTDQRAYDRRWVISWLVSLLLFAPIIFGLWIHKKIRCGDIFGGNSTSS